MSRVSNVSACSSVCEHGHKCKRIGNLHRILCATKSTQTILLKNMNEQTSEHTLWINEPRNEPCKMDKNTCKVHLIFQCEHNFSFSRSHITRSFFAPQITRPIIHPLTLFCTPFLFFFFFNVEGD